MVKQPILNCCIHQISETIIRSNVGTDINPKSQQLLLINQRGRHICFSQICPQYVFLCVLSLPLSACCLWLPTDAIPVSTYTRTHTHSLSVSLLPCLSFFPLKRCCDTFMVIIEIQDSIVFSCSHFISVALTRKLSNCQNSRLKHCKDCQNRRLMHC